MHSWVRSASLRTTGSCNLQTSPEPGGEKRGSETPDNACTLHYALSQVIRTFTLFAEVTGEVKLACRHHGLPLPLDMDFTHPAGWLHLTQAPVHPLILEYNQGMWRFISSVYTLNPAHSHYRFGRKAKNDLCHWLTAVVIDCVEK